MKVTLFLLAALLGCSVAEPWPPPPADYKLACFQHAGVYLVQRGCIPSQATGKWSCPQTKAFTVSLWESRDACDEGLQQMIDDKIAENRP